MAKKFDNHKYLINAKRYYNKVQFKINLKADNIIVFLNSYPIVYVQQDEQGDQEVMKLNQKNIV